jgi:hypothetical protein
VTQAQEAWLEQLREERGEWRDWLPIELDERWPAWRESDGASLTGYLDGLQPEFVVAAADPASSEAADPLGWLTADQQARLDSLTAGRGPWHEWLPGQLDSWWPEWSSSDPATLQSWFESVLASLVPEDTGDDRTVAQAGEGSSDPSDLKWVTPAQAGQLDDLHEIRGDWHEWLPVELDRLGSWRQSAPEDLAPWLDSLIPTFVLPTDSVDIEESPEIARLVEDHPDLGNLSDEELRNLMDETLADGSERPQ